MREVIHAPHEFMHHELIHASRVNIHASRVNSCIKSRFTHRKLIHASLDNIHALRVNIHASQINIHASQINIHKSQVKFFMHREKNDFLAKVYISKEKFIPCGIHTSREDVIPRKILCIARRFNSSQKFTYRKKISYLAEFMHREKI